MAANMATKNIVYGKELKHVSLERESREGTDYTLTDHIIHVQNTLRVDARTTSVLNAFVRHLHAFVRALGRAPVSEAMDAVFVLCASFGVDEVLFGLQDARPEGCTRTSQEGPFYLKEGVPVLPSGASIASQDTKGEKLFFEGTVRNHKGEAIKDAVVDVWHADGDGVYDVQYGVQRDDRALILANADGTFTFRGVMPAADTAFSENGPVYELLQRLGRHAYRATHIHFHIEAPGYETLVTQIFPSTSPILGDNIIFAAQPSLIAPVTETTDPSAWAAMGFKDEEVIDGKVWVWKFDFVLPTAEEMEEAKKKLDQKFAETLP